MERLASAKDLGLQKPGLSYKRVEYIRYKLDKNIYICIHTNHSQNPKLQCGLQSEIRGSLLLNQEEYR